MQEIVEKIILDNEPHFILKTRRHSSNKTASIPIPDMEITKGIDAGHDARVWIEKSDKKIVMLVVMENDGK